MRPIIVFVALTWLAGAQAPGFDSLLQRGLLALERGDPRAAEVSLEEAGKQRPRDARVWIGLAQTYRRSGRVEAAKEAADRAAQFAPADPMVLRALAVVYAESKAWDGAIAALREALRLSPYEEASYFDLGRTMLIAQDFRGAVEVLEKGRKMFDKSPQIALALGVAYYGQRRFSDAVDTFLKTITLAPEVEQPYIFLGRILEQDGDRLPEITGKFAAFAAANPQNYLGPFLHAKALLADPAAGPATQAQAESLLRKSRSLNEGFWESHFELGILLEGKREYAKARPELERAIELNPTNAASHYRLARVYDRLGKPQQAATERALHQKYVDAERAVMGQQGGGKPLDLVVK